MKTFKQKNVVRQNSRRPEVVPRSSRGRPELDYPPSDNLLRPGDDGKALILISGKDVVIVTVCVNLQIIYDSHIVSSQRRHAKTGLKLFGGLFVTSAF